MHLCFERGGDCHNIAIVREKSGYVYCTINIRDISKAPQDHNDWDKITKSFAKHVDVYYFRDQPLNLSNV